MLQTKIQLFLCHWVNADCWQLWMKWGSAKQLLCVGGVSVFVSVQVYMLVCMCACGGQGTILDITKRLFLSFCFVVRWDGVFKLLGTHQIGQADRSASPRGLCHSSSGILSAQDYTQLFKMGSGGWTHNFMLARWALYWQPSSKTFVLRKFKRKFHRCLTWALIKMSVF